jgi:hypothetical protein
MSAVLPGESLRSCLATILGVWLLVFLYAAVHDQFLIRIHPEHFTVWHYRIPFTENLTLLALLYAFGGSISPGLFLGVVLYVSGRLFDLPKKKVSWLLSGTVWVIVASEVFAIAAGLLAWRMGRGIYPEFLYPDASAGLAITQSVQLTAYLAGAAFSALLMAWTWWSRWCDARRLKEVCPAA